MPSKRDSRPLWLWDKCCRDIGIDPRLVKPYFPPIDEVPDWTDISDGQLGEAFREDGCSPEVFVFLHNVYEKGRPLLTVRQLSEIIYHELIHVLLDDASEEEVSWLAITVSRRRPGFKYHQSYLKEKAFEQSLGPPQESWTLFQWARWHRPVGTRERP